MRKGEIATFFVKTLRKGARKDDRRFFGTDYYEQFGTACLVSGVRPRVFFCWSRGTEGSWVWFDGCITHAAPVEPSGLGEINRAVLFLLTSFSYSCPRRANKPVFRLPSRALTNGPGMLFL